MKKVIFLLGIAAIGIFFAFKAISIVSRQEFETTCKTLAKLTDSAIKNNRRGDVAIYYNAFRAMKVENSFESSCDEYFEKIRVKYSPTLGSWNINTEYPPKFTLPGGGGGFDHHEVDLLGKIKNHSLKEADIQVAILAKELSKGEVKAADIKNLDIVKIQDLYKKLKELNVEKVDPLKLKNLSKPSYNLKELKEQTHGE